MKPVACRGNWLAAARTTGRSRLSDELGTPPRDAITRPFGSVTRNNAFSSEILDQSSRAVSRIVGSLPVLNAARTEAIVLRIKLTRPRFSARDFQSDSYA